MFRNLIQKANQKFAKRFLYFLAGVSPLFATLLAITPLPAKSLQAADNSSKSTSPWKSDKQDLITTIAQASESGKPLLTQKNINSSIPINPRSPEFIKLVQEAQSDLKAFIPSRFSLTPRQLQGLKALNREDLAKVQDAIKDAQKTGTPLRVRFLPSDGSTNSSKPELQVSRESKTADNLNGTQPDDSDIFCSDCEIVIVISVRC